MTRILITLAVLITIAIAIVGSNPRTACGKYPYEPVKSVSYTSVNNTPVKSTPNECSKQDIVKEINDIYNKVVAQDIKASHYDVPTEEEKLKAKVRELEDELEELKNN